MIVNICLFLLCCFGISSNIKTIESAGNQINPIRVFVRPCSELNAKTINNLKTFNKCPVNIKPKEQRILSVPDCGHIKSYQLQLKSRHKLEKRAKDIKCSFCVIAKSNIVYLKDLIEELKSGNPFINYQDKVKRLKEEAEIILELLLRPNLETSKWLWSYYLIIIAISQYDNNNAFNLENLFKDDQLQTDVSEFIQNCIDKKYLPMTSTESDLLSKNPCIYDNMFIDLRGSGMFSDILNGQVVFVTTNFLYLKPFWSDENQFLSKKITEVDVDWTIAKQRHEVEVVITREFVENRTWIYKPYGRLDHQHLVMKMIDARIYCYVSVILHIYEKQLIILDEQSLNHNRVNVYIVMQDVMKLTAYKDDFLLDMVSEFKFAKLNDTSDIKDISARVRAKANEILSDLNGTSKNKIDWLSFNINEEQLFTDDFIIRIIMDFRFYLNELDDLCFPFEYGVFLHFIDVVKSSVDINI